jgi:hypothetical protein
MTERSQKLARYIRKQRESTNLEQQVNQDQLLETGFALLRDDLAREFHKQIEDVNSEPACINTLGSSFSNKESQVFKIGEEGKGLTVDFNKDERTAEIKGKEPVKFYYFVRVRLAKDGGNWCYAGGENKEDLAPVTGKLDTIVEKALFALFGVQA